MNFMTHMMDWLPELFVGIGIMVLCIAVLALVACFIDLKISWVRSGSISFNGFKWPWKKESK